MLKTVPRPLDLAASLPVQGLGSGLRTLCIGGEGEVAHGVIRALTGISAHLIVLEWRSQRSIDSLLAVFGGRLTLLAEPWPQDRLLYNLDLVVSNLGNSTHIENAERDWRPIARALRVGGAYVTLIDNVPADLGSVAELLRESGSPRIVEIAEGDPPAGRIGSWLVIQKTGPAPVMPAYGSGQDAETGD